jgi:hypothetical protein
MYIVSLYLQDSVCMPVLRRTLLYSVDLETCPCDGLLFASKPQQPLEQTCNCSKARPCTVRRHEARSQQTTGAFGPFDRQCEAGLLVARTMYYRRPPP